LAQLIEAILNSEQALVAAQLGPHQKGARRGRKCV
jgi:hypothetical protein